MGVTWSGGNEGTGSGHFNVNGAGGTRGVSVTGDSRQADWVDNVRQAGCGTNCAANSMVYIQTIIKAGNGATPAASRADLLPGGGDEQEHGSAGSTPIGVAS